MQCRNCNRDIPGDALLCPYCGESVASSDETLAPAPPAAKRTGIWVAVIAILAVALVCFSCLLCAALGTTTPSYEATSTAQAAARQTEAARPTNTAIPTYNTATTHSPTCSGNRTKRISAEHEFVGQAR
jgi:hypothetical protein